MTNSRDRAVRKGKETLGASHDAPSPIAVQVKTEAMSEDGFVEKVSEFCQLLREQNRMLRAQHTARLARIPKGNPSGSLQ